LKCYKRALINSEPGEINVFGKIARTCSVLGQEDTAAAYHRAAVDMAVNDGLDLGQYAKHCIAVVRWEIGKSKSKDAKTDVDVARRYANMCLEPTFAGPVRLLALRFPRSLTCTQERDEAKELLGQLVVLEMDDDAI
jgi:hypothetical protein